MIDDDPIRVATRRRRSGYPCGRELMINATMYTQSHNGQRYERYDQVGAVERATFATIISLVRRSGRIESDALHAERDDTGSSSRGCSMSLPRRFRTERARDRRVLGERDAFPHIRRDGTRGNSN